jgi:hypothetical protein
MLPAHPPPRAVRLIERLAPIRDDARRANETAAIYAQELSKTGLTCSAITRLSEAGEAPLPERSQRYVQIAAEIVQKCGCDSVDVDALEYISLHLFRAFTPARRVLRVRFSSSGKLVLGLPAGTVDGQTFVDAIVAAAAGKSSEAMLFRLGPTSAAVRTKSSPLRNP